MITTQDNHVVNLDARVAQSSTLLGDMPEVYYQCEAMFEAGE